MNREQIDFNRQALTDVLLSIRKPGLDAVVSALADSGFFTARCQGHDESEGGLANHALWTLSIAKEKCDDELLPLAVIAFHAPSAASRSDLEIAEEVRSVVVDSARLAIEYADSIPFGTDRTEPYEVTRVDEYVNIIFDQDDHVIWSGAEGRTDVFDDSATLSEFPVHHILNVAIRPDGSDDVRVMFDDESKMCLMFLSEEGEPELHRSDRVMFGYTGLEFYITRFPQHRSSYIAVRNAKGVWGVMRVRENRKRGNDHKILVERVVDYKWRSAEKAVGHMTGHTGYPISVQDPNFYTRIVLDV